MNHPYYHTYSEHPLIPTHEESWVIENLLNNEPLPAIYDTVLRTNPRGDQSTSTSTPTPKTKSAAEPT